MQSNPIVKWVGKKVGEKVHLIRLDIQTEAAKTVMRKYNISLNSAYVIFDADGNEVWRSYTIPLNGRKAVRILNRLLTS